MELPFIYFLFWLCAGQRNLGLQNANFFFLFFFFVFFCLTPWQQSQPSQGQNEESNLTSRDMNFWSVASGLLWGLTVIPLDSSLQWRRGAGRHNGGSPLLQASAHNLKAQERWSVLGGTTSCNWTVGTVMQIILTCVGPLTYLLYSVCLHDITILSNTSASRRGPLLNKHFNAFLKAKVCLMKLKSPRVRFVTPISDWGPQMNELQIQAQLRVWAWHFVYFFFFFGQWLHNFLSPFGR